MTRFSFQLDRPPGPVLVGTLIFCSTRISEPGAHPEEVLSGSGALHGGSKTKEAMVLNGALPQVFAGFLVVQPRKISKRVIKMQKMYKFKYRSNNSIEKCRPVHKYERKKVFT